MSEAASPRKWPGLRELDKPVCRLCAKASDLPAGGQESGVRVQDYRSVSLTHPLSRADHHLTVAPPRPL